MTQDEALTSYKLQDLEQELAEANALAFRCSQENVALRLQLSTAQLHLKQREDVIENVRLYTRLHHTGVQEAMLGLRRMIDVDE